MTTTRTSRRPSPGLWPTSPRVPRGRRTLLLALVLLAGTARAETAADCAARKGKWMQANGWIGCMLANTRDGEWKHEGPGGQLLERSEWVRGKRSGAHVRYFDNCQVSERGAYLAGLREGPWVFWNEEGKKEREGAYEKNRETGTWVEYHRDTGLKHLEGPYVHGHAQGRFTEYLPRGEKWREVEFSAGRRAGEQQQACDDRGGEWTVDFKNRREGCIVGNKEDGPWLGYDGNGKLRWKTTFVKGRITGLYEEFHPAGQLLRKGQYVGGVPEGKHEFRGPDGAVYGASSVWNGTGAWRSFHPNGKPAEEGRYEEGCMAGLWTTTSEEGRVTLEETWAACHREGPYTWYHGNGQRRLVGQYHEGHAVGAWKAFYSNGDPDWAGTYDMGDRTGDWKFWRWGKQLRAEGPMEADVPKGQWTDYHPTGKPSESGQRVGLRNEGTWKTYWSTGEPWRDVEWVNGEEQDDAAKTCTRWGGVWSADGEKRTLGCLVCRARPDDSIELLAVGVWTFWHPGGGIEKQGALAEGKPSGGWKYFHDNGAVMMRGAFDGGVEVGAWTGAYRSGQLRFEGAYVEGKPDGLWTSWLTDGGVLSVGRYEKGVKVGAWKYERNGQLVTVTVVPDAGVP